MSPRPWIPRDLNEPAPGTPTSQSDEAIGKARVKCPECGASHHPMTRCPTCKEKVDG